MGRDRSRPCIACARVGCKAWAKHGQEYCAAHAAKGDSKPEPHGQQGLYRQYLSEDEIVLLSQAPEGDIFGLDKEIEFTVLGHLRLFAEGQYKDAAMLATYKARLLEARQRLLETGESDLARELEILLSEVEKPRGVDLGRGSTIIPTDEEGDDYE